MITAENPALVREQSDRGNLLNLLLFTKVTKLGYIPAAVFWKELLSLAPKLKRTCLLNAFGLE